MSPLRLTVWNHEECKKVHEATLAVLERTGVEVLYEPAREILRKAGARVDGNRAFLRAELVQAALESAPTRWELPSRSEGSQAIILDATHSYFGTGSDCLFFADPVEGRRRTCLPDIEALAVLGERLENIDFVMSMGLPEDVPRCIDDLAPVGAMLRGTSKPIIAAPKDGSVVAPIREMASIAGHPGSVAVYAMPSPPLMHDADALTKVMSCAALEVPLIYAPAPAAGAGAPASVTATVLVGNAEVLSGLVLHQLTRPGSPFVYGAGYSALNMRTMVDCYAAPEHFLGLQAGCDLAVYYGLPSFSYAAVSDAKTLDQQCAAEYGLTTILGALSRATLLHDVGYLESGLLGSAETVILGDELIGWARAFDKGAPVDDYSLAVEEIAAVGPGGSHLARPRTRQHHRDTWQSTLFDHSRHERWVADGQKDLKEHLCEKRERLAGEPRPYELDTRASQEIERVISRRLLDQRGA